MGGFEDDSSRRLWLDLTVRPSALELMRRALPSYTPGVEVFQFFLTLVDLCVVPLAVLLRLVFAPLFLRHFQQSHFRQAYCAESSLDGFAFLVEALHYSNSDARMG